MLLGAAMSWVIVTVATGYEPQTSVHSKPHGFIVDCTVDRLGRTVVLQLEDSSGGVSTAKLLTFSESYVLIDERRVDRMSNFVRDLGPDIVVGSMGNNQTLLKSSRNAWALPGYFSDVRALRKDGLVLIGLQMQPGRSKTNVAAWRLRDDRATTLLNVALKNSVKFDQIFTTQRGLYAIGAMRSPGLYRLQGDTEPFIFELLVKGRFNIGGGASLGDGEVVAVVPTQLMIQNVVELRSLPDGNVVQLIKFPYSVVDVSMARGKGGQGVLLVKSKESIGKAQLLMLDRSGREIRRKDVAYRSRLAGSWQGDRVVLVGSDTIVDVTNVPTSIE